MRASSDRTLNQAPSAASRDTAGSVAVASETVMIACGTSVSRNALE